MGILLTWKQRAKRLKGEVLAVYLACRDPRTPWYAKLVAACVAGYALSPIDLIPDPVPVLGYLDDLIIVPLGLALVLRMIPPAVLAECREKAKKIQEKPTSWTAAGVIIAIWIVSALVVVLFRHRAVPHADVQNRTLRVRQSSSRSDDPDFSAGYGLGPLA